MTHLPSGVLRDRTDAISVSDVPQPAASCLPIVKAITLRAPATRSLKAALASVEPDVQVSSKSNTCLPETGRVSGTSKNDGSTTPRPGRPALAFITTLRFHSTGHLVTDEKIVKI